MARSASPGLRRVTKAYASGTPGRRSGGMKTSSLCGIMLAVFYRRYHPRSDIATYTMNPLKNEVNSAFVVAFTRFPMKRRAPVGRLPPSAATGPLAGMLDRAGSLLISGLMAVLPRLQFSASSVSSGLRFCRLWAFVFNCSG